MPNKQTLALFYGLDPKTAQEREGQAITKRFNEYLESKIIERTAELLKANCALEAFSYSVSHDLRSPLHTIIGFASIIRRDYEQGFSSELSELFGYIETGGKRMIAIVDNMISLAHCTKSKLVRAPVDMKELVNRVWDDMLFSSPHQATLKLSNLPTISADSSLLEQVIVNLVSNAIKYSSKKEIPVITIGSVRTKEASVFYFRDNGAGFDMKFRDRLFKDFQRLHGPSEFEGTGVGLSIVKMIVERHGGSVWAEGKTNEGALFVFSIPHEIVNVDL